MKLKLAVSICFLPVTNSDEHLSCVLAYLYIFSKEMTTQICQFFLSVTLCLLVEFSVLDLLDTALAKDFVSVCRSAVYSLQNAQNFNFVEILFTFFFYCLYLGITSKISQEISRS